MYKLSFFFLLHSLLDNGARMTPKRRSVFSLIFIVNCIFKNCTEYEKSVNNNSISVQIHNQTCNNLCALFS